MKRCLVSAAAAFILAQAPAVAQSDQPVGFARRVGNWLIVGDPKMGACMATGPHQGDKSLSMAVTGVADEFQFALQGPSWKSLADGDMRLGVVFTGGTKSGDQWDLEATGTSAANGGPRINWTILRAKNDGANFVDAVRGAGMIHFFKDKSAVIIASFDLAGSAAAIETLLECRTMIRDDKEFDPFAGSI